MTEIALRGEQAQTSLSLATEQTYWNENQIAALKHMGVEDASPGDLAVFFHVVKRTGLDPFARQIHMIGRNTKNQRTQQWETKYTIQTGIDGFRLIGRRAADRARVKVSVPGPEWAREDGQWVPLWSPKWGLPIAARATVYRDGEPFTGVALFDEYKQTKRDGALTSMWAQRPAGQLAKCAEALAWRMAFPQDMQGVYVEDEMHQVDNARPSTEGNALSVTAFTEPVPEPRQDDPLQEFTDAGHEPMTDPTRRRLFAMFTEAGIKDADEQRAGMSRVLGRTVESRASLSEEDAQAVIGALAARAQATEPALPIGDES